MRNRAQRTENRQLEHEEDAIDERNDDKKNPMSFTFHIFFA